jgi:hypothetical protein
MLPIYLCMCGVWSFGARPRLQPGGHCTALLFVSAGQLMMGLLVWR